KDEIETQVGLISTFPRDAEKPSIAQVVRKQPAILVGIHGDLSEDALKIFSDSIRDELLKLPQITLIDYLDNKEREISIEVSEAKLQMYGFTFSQVSQAIRRESVNIPAGLIRSDGGEIMVRTIDQKYTGQQMKSIILRANPDGSQIRLGDVATVIDSFKDDNRKSLMDGINTKVLRIYKTSGQDLIKIADAVKAYVAKKQSELPSNIEMLWWSDSSRMVKGRLALMVRNGLQGLLLVFLGLTLFLELRLAFFVALGIPISFLGAFVLMQFAGQSFNMLSLFAMILVLGIVVDDAVVVGESIFQRLRKGEKPEWAAYNGTTQVFWPVVASVSTTIVAFVPLYFVDGMMGKFFAVVPFVVIAALLLSLVESIIILPGHIAHHVKPIQKQNFFTRLQAKMQRLMQEGIEWFIRRVYLKSVRFILRYRYAAVASAFSLLIISVGMIAGGRVEFNFMPKTDNDVVLVYLEFAPGIDFKHTEKWADHILSKLYVTEKNMREQFEVTGRKAGFPFVKHVYTSIGNGGSHNARIQVELLPAENRNIHYMEILEEWRKEVGVIPEAVKVRYASRMMGPSGQALAIHVQGNNFNSMIEVKDKLKSEISKYPFVNDIYDDFTIGKLEARLQLKPLARHLGISLRDVATQLRQSYFGDQALRIQRGKDDIRVYVRYPRSERRSLDSLTNMFIRTPQGRQIPFSQVAEIVYARGYSIIKHKDRNRIINVFADIDSKKGNSGQLVSELGQDFVPMLKKDHPDVSISFGGQAEQRAKSLGSLYMGFFIAMLVIYTILSTIFRSYMQPLIIMMAIPFGFIGAVFGHMVMGMKLTIMSMFGLVALAGIVVNNSLLLIEFINRKIRAGSPMMLAVSRSGQERFMAIFLTSVTTCLGITPMLFEKSIQAQFLQPCVVSLGFGLVGSTIFTLLLIPAMYVILYDIRASIASFFRGYPVKPIEFIRKSTFPSDSEQ
ncbi:MAG: efflux RND transporter permease subunit, partial [bacterium]|nr:efflux RND transporter permease subunit [bacterium]